MCFNVLLIIALLPVSISSSVVFLRLQAAEGRQEELTQRGAKEKRELELRIEEMEEKEQVLQARIEALQADNDFTNERLAALQGSEHGHPPPPFPQHKLAEVGRSCGRTRTRGSSTTLCSCLPLLFTVRLEQLQEKSTKENNSLGESVPLPWHVPSLLCS